VPNSSERPGPRRDMPEAHQRPAGQREWRALRIFRPLAIVGAVCLVGTLLYDAGLSPVAPSLCQERLRLTDPLVWTGAAVLLLSSLGALRLARSYVKVSTTGLDFRGMFLAKSIRWSNVRAVLVYPSLGNIELLADRTTVALDFRFAHMVQLKRHVVYMARTWAPQADIRLGLPRWLLRARARWPVVRAFLPHDGSEFLQDGPH
jgi:hypothetical protein